MVLLRRMGMLYRSSSALKIMAFKSTKYERPLYVYLKFEWPLRYLFSSMF